MAPREPAPAEDPLLYEDTLVDNFDYSQQDTVIEDNNDQTIEKREYVTEAIKSSIIKDSK